MTVHHERIRFVTSTPTNLFRWGGKQLVQISVFTLGIGYDVDNLVHLLFQFRIFLQCQQIGCPFHHLEQVRSNVSWQRQQLPLTGFQILPCTAQVLYRRLRLFQRERYQGLLLSLESWQPERILQGYLLEGYRCQRFVAFLWHRSVASRQEQCRAHTC